MRRLLPPLNAIKAFEATARHMSFKTAADELCVTPQAVSHQIKVLEDYLRLSVFRRHNRFIELTEAGAALLPTVRRSLGDLADGVAQVMQQNTDEILTINATPAFAVRWLIPKLPDFQTAYPNLEYRLTAMVDLPKLHTGAVDVAIHWSDARDETGLWVERLMTCPTVAVCSPALLGDAGRLEEPADLAQFTLMHHTVDPSFWKRWFRLVGIDNVDAGHGPCFESNVLMLEAAVAGVGVCLVAREDAERYIRSGELVIPLDIALPFDSSFYLMCAEERRDEAKIADFRAWIRSEIVENLSSTNDLDH